MNLGSILTERVTVLRATRVSNGAGGFSDTWASIGDTWGKLTAVVSTAGRERSIGGGVTAAELYEAVLDRLETEAAVKDRLRDAGDREYEVLAAHRQGRYLIVSCREVDAT